MQFPASDEEKQLVYKTAGELMKHLENAGQSAAELASCLHENFLALDEAYRQHIFASLRKIDAESWRTKIQKVNLRNQQERIISAP